MFLLPRAYLPDSCADHGSRRTVHRYSWKLWLLKEPLWFTQTLKGYGFRWAWCMRYDRYHRGIIPALLLATGISNRIKKNGG